MKSARFPISNLTIFELFKVSLGRVDKKDIMKTRFIPTQFGYFRIGSINAYFVVIVELIFGYVSKNCDY